MHNVGLVLVIGAVGLACNSAPPGDDGAVSGVGEATGSDDATEDTGSSSSSGRSGDEKGDGADDRGPSSDTKGFDVGAADDSHGDDTPGACNVRQCDDTSANAVVSLVPCDDWFGTFRSPYDEHYECWMGSTLAISYIGDTGVAFAYDDPDLLLTQTYMGEIQQLGVTRDANCNITGFTAQNWEPYSAPESDDVFVRDISFLDDGTMVMLRLGSDLYGYPSVPQIGQRSPGATETSKVDDLMPLLAAWPQLTFSNDPAAGLAVVPAGFPGAGSVKLIVEKESSSHWHTLPLSPDGSGTYDVGAAVEETTVAPPQDGWGGYYNRGIAFIGPELPDVDVPSVFITEAWHYILAIYELDDDGNPVLETRKEFIEGLGMPSGADRDPVSQNNFVFTGRRSGDVYVIRGCEAAPPSTDPRG
jgi:hypothetical protein